MRARVFFVKFPSENVKRSPPEEIFVKRSPPEPKKIARYLVLSTQKKAKNRGSKKFYPLKTRFLDDSRGVSGKNFFEPKIFGKIDFYCIFRPLFFENLPKFSKTAPSAPIFGPFGPENEKISVRNLKFQLPRIPQIRFFPYMYQGRLASSYKNKVLL